MNPNTIHTFHIPVMGLSYTVDTPLRVAHYGISSVVSITDDELLEKMRAFYSAQFSVPYQEIKQKFNDYRAQRITSYLNFMDKLVRDKVDAFKNELSGNREALEKYITTLPHASEFKKKLESLLHTGEHIKEAVKTYLDNFFLPGAIDVNVMTKVDKPHFDKENTPLPVAFNDAHAAVRGFAQSSLNSSLVLSAGMNPKLYSYLETFSDFFPDAAGQLKKKIVLKVSDFRSAMIQGHFLAKKGLWVSEYRIESGLNCGGHAFATDGFLLGPILQEFKDKKHQLVTSAHELLSKALEIKKLPVPQDLLPLKITAQGGVGTAEEHAFLLSYYELDSVGWGSPFLLVPEATSVDEETRTLLKNAHEEDFYLSNISPLGVPFNSVKGVSNDFWKEKRIAENKAGSSCPKKLLALDTTYENSGLCTASKKYQDIKLKELESIRAQLTSADFDKRKHGITVKACLCVGLANASYLENNIPIKGQQQGVVICPGPNLAYFDKEVSLTEMVQHIYGGTSVMTQENRPHFFIKELGMYTNHLQNEMASFSDNSTAVQIKKWSSFREHLLNGIAYYEQLFSEVAFFTTQRLTIYTALQHYKTVLTGIKFS
ncbi:hypothetical protein QW060_16180 [Myroides ceti]|uniref:Uncharacterized protein n=1 Tax=Paenimyroides ceti TaxID=395087 RepID=A0ABT8CX06_9FLAO|nr:hypothetical protein [Paenimyroides ceti]MDN3708641.1 hypothetical protein [Paenimyroides ceti]